MFGGFWCLVSAVDFLWMSFGPFSLGKQPGKISPKNPPKNPWFSGKLFDQNPLREISSMTIMVATCLGMKLVMSYVKFLKPVLHTTLLANAVRRIGAGGFLGRAGWLLNKLGRVLKNPVDVPKEFDTTQRPALRLPEYWLSWGGRVHNRGRQASRWTFQSPIPPADTHNTTHTRF